MALMKAGTCETCEAAVFGVPGQAVVGLLTDGDTSGAGCARNRERSRRRKFIRAWLDERGTMRWHL